MLPVLHRSSGWDIGNWRIVTLAVLAGILIQTSQILYFQALAYSEAGIVAAYWNLTPSILPIVSFFLLGTVLHIYHYIGIGILILASTGFCLLDANFKIRWDTFWLMGMACCIQAIALLIEDYIFHFISLFSGFIFITVGIIFCGIPSLLVQSVRRSLWKTLRIHPMTTVILLAIEGINLLALFMSQRAIAVGLPSLVAAVESTIPAYVFLLSMLMFAINRQIVDPRALKRLPLKLGLLTAIVTAVWLVSNS
jgi:uncharacterized membrane protein